jgi:hypothetical protein
MKSNYENLKVLWPLYAITYISINGFYGTDFLHLTLFAQITTKTSKDIGTEAFLLFLTAVTKTIRKK